MLKFVNSWLAREQDKGITSRPGTALQAKQLKGNNFTQREYQKDEYDALVLAALGADIVYGEGG